MVIAALVSFAILFIAWALAPEQRSSEAPERPADIEGLRLAA